MPKRKPEEKPAETIGAELNTLASLPIQLHQLMTELGRYLILQRNYEETTDLNSRHGWEIDARNQFEKLEKAYHDWSRGIGK